ncbi:MAG TPA: BTAD domain-containing putative transcriptional regulator [Rhizomicrobium sp.]|jgi:DNA-binding SARP family transcriptional activator/TolB-like protein/Flp pilus assembly protein TadD|nr:BTAD domain-containing putative transcriptional regulator [Rhizomicrobium sp.]
MLERVFQEPKFRVCCLGGLKLVEARSGTDRTPTSRKTRALIGYLSIIGKPAGRERLAPFLWGDRGDEQARASLRQAIYELRSTPGGNCLLRVERDTVAVGEHVDTDVAAIMAAAQSGDLYKLIETLSEWKGDFFEGLPAIDPAFDAWLQTERVRVHERLIEAAAEAIRVGIAKGETDPARKIVNLLQQRDSTNEAVLRLGLHLDHLAGDTAALHRRYERFRELLKSELDAAPSLETQRLFQELIAAPPAPMITVESGNAAERADQYVERGEGRGALCPAESVPVRTADAMTSETRTGHWPIRSVFRLATTAFAVALLGVALWIVWSSLHRAVPSPPPLVAVLPFQTLSADPGSRYVADGIAKEIAGALAGKSQIRIALAEAGSGFHNDSAPKALAATHILSGSVERVGSRLHVIAQLMEINDDRVVWSRAYNAAAAQSAATHNVAAQIAGGVGKVLASGSFDKAPHVNSAAYDHYLKGRALFRQRNARRAVAELETSVRLAPNFGKGWSTLAAAHWLLATSALAERKGAYDPSMATAARAAAQRALVLDPEDGEALGVLALLVSPPRLRQIDRELERALHAESHNPQLLGWHGEFLMFVGRNQQALDELTRAYELDSGTPSVRRNLVLASLRTGRFEEASEIIKQDRGHDSSLRKAVLRFQIKSLLYRRNWFGLANYLNTLSNRDARPMAASLRLYRDTAVALGTRETEKFGALRTSWRARASVDPDDAVHVLSALGDADGAFEALQAAVGSRQNDELLTDPEWEALFVPDLVPLRRD